MRLNTNIRPGLLLLLIIAAACNHSTNNQSETMDNVFSKGSYGFDVDFFKKNNINCIELRDSTSKAAVLIIPAYQGRVMTSTAEGKEGTSFGWINYKFIEAGVPSSQFNPFGGEERLWIGPEGGKFSIYFPDGKEQVFANWKVPKEIDNEPFDIVHQNTETVSFTKDFELFNASGMQMQIGIERKLSILSREMAEKALNIELHDSLSFVAYESENILTNKGQIEWNSETGIVSIWMLSMFNPLEKGVVFIPFKKGDLGKKVSDDYFGKIPSDKLSVKEDVLFFKIDGKYRSKIGISPERALPFCGSYDPLKKVLTILWYSSPETPAKYLNSKWGEQEDPLEGDVVNSYNDGPNVDGSIMGPFYEIESSSPAALLSPGEKMMHTQQIFHITGDESKLNEITEKLFNLSITEIKQAFN